MRYYKEIVGAYVSAVGVGLNDTEITEDEYNEILSIIHNKPASPSGYDYMLRADTLEWELVELPPMPEPEPTAEELLDIILGGAGE